MNISNVQSIVDLALTIENRQVKQEFYELCLEFIKLPRKVVVELGVYEGATLSAFSLLQQLETLIGIDKACWPVNRSEEQYRSLITGNLNSICVDINNVDIIVGDSHSIDTDNKINDILNGRKIDFIFIDADHNYQAVKADYEMYLKYMNTNSIMAFHDIFKLHGFPIGAATFWNEIKSNYKHLEIRDSINTPSNWESGGIGVLYI